MRHRHFQSLVLDVPTLGTVSAACGSLVLQEILKHFLNMRCQIPGCYDEIFGQLQERQEPASPPENETSGSEQEWQPQRSKPVKLNATERKIAKTIQSAEGVLKHMSPQLLGLQRDWWISFLFGPTPQRPHESYDIKLSIAGPFVLEGEREEEADSHAKMEASTHKALARRVIRSLIMQEDSIPDGKASKGSTKVFVMTRCSAQKEAPAGFLPKRGLQMTSQRGVQVVIDLTGSHSCMPEVNRTLKGCEGHDAVLDDEVQASCTGSSERLCPEEMEKDCDMIWYQCKRHITGCYMQGKF